MDIRLQQTLDQVADLVYHCERGNNLDRAEALLREATQEQQSPHTLARLHAELAQVEFWRYEYAPESRRLAIAESGVRLAKSALTYDSNSLEANAWAAALMGIHGLEMGILSSLFYIGQVKACAERALELNEAYQNAMPHQILGDLYRLTPPSPVGFRDKHRALGHLQRARELAPTCPQAKLRLAELYIGMRKHDLARSELQAVLEQEIEEHGPLYAGRCQARARNLLAKLP
ncbi:MAG: TRAP transporter TatT component family protein [Bacillota bacterium]